jgi:CheY-like chemotaxis protein
MYCYYPTTTVAIDDDAEFLKTITQHVEITDCISYSSPNKALEFLKDQNAFQRIQSRILKTAVVPEDINSMPDDYALLINMHRLHEEIYFKTRFNDVSVLIVDYYMDDISGIDVCESLTNHPAKKILLTGGADKEKIAIEAFNKGIIHRFINKSDPDFTNQLKQAVATLKEAYFRDLTSTILPYISPSNTALLQNPAYINFINNLQNQFSAIEYYLLDATGSSIFLDAESKPLWLVVKHESEINNYKKIAQEQEQDVDRAFIQTLEKYEKIPFFFLDEDYQHPASEWGKFLYSAHPLPGIRGYHYAIVEGHIRNNLAQEKMRAYSPHPSSVK